MVVRQKHSNVRRRSSRTSCLGGVFFFFVAGVFVWWMHPSSVARVQEVVTHERITASGARSPLIMDTGASHVEERALGLPRTSRAMENVSKSGSPIRDHGRGLCRRCRDLEPRFSSARETRRGQGKCRRPSNRFWRCGGMSTAMGAQEHGDRQEEVPSLRCHDRLFDAEACGVMSQVRDIADLHRPRSYGRWLRTAEAWRRRSHERS